jgi:hypothetical protein
MYGSNSRWKLSMINLLKGYLALAAIAAIFVGVRELCEIWPPLFSVLLALGCGFPFAMLLGVILQGKGD